MNYLQSYCEQTANYYKNIYFRKIEENYTKQGFVFKDQKKLNIKKGVFMSLLFQEAKIGNMMTERQLLRIFIFFAQGLGRVQLTRYKGRFTLSVSQLSLDQ